MKNKTLKRLLLLLLAAVLLVSLTACGSKDEKPADEPVQNDPQTDAPSPDGGKEYEEGQEASGNDEKTRPEGIQEGTIFKWVSTIDMPIYVPWVNNSASLLTYQLYDNLLCKYHSDSDDIRGNLAESWTVSDDGLVWVFKLKEGVKFISGNDFNADAVVKSWDAAKEYQPRYFAPVESYVATGDYELTVTLSAPSPTFIYDLPLQPQCGIVDPAALAEFGPENNGSAVGTGPYYVDSYSAGEKFVLKANPNYHNPDRAPSIETCEISILPDENTALLAVMNGELDGLKTNSVETRANLVENNWQVYDIPFIASPYWLNPRECELFKDPVVREALCHLIDWNAVNELVYDGLFAVGDSIWMGPGEYAYDDSYSYDPDLGIKMLEDAGYSKDDIKFVILGDPGFTAANTAVVAQFNELGFMNVTTETYDQGTCYGRLLAGDYQMFPCHNGYSWESPLTPYSMGLMPNGTQRCMWLEYMDEDAAAEAYAHYEAALVAPDFETYTAEVAEITRIVQEQHAAMGGLRTTDFYAVNPRFGGVYINGLGGYIEFFSLWDTQV